MRNLQVFEIMFDLAPGLLATQLRQAFNKENKYTDLHMGVNGPLNPMAVYISIWVFFRDRKQHSITISPL
jgi:hypothetical protein